MHEMNYKRNELLANSLIKELNSRNMEAFYCANKKEALDKVLSIIDKDSSITMGGCQSAIDIGLTDILKSKEYNFIDRDKMDQREALIKGYDADYFISSVNAISEDGILVNIDGYANRVSYICNGPKHVLFIVGMNKVCKDLDSAMKRARNVAAPINAQRFDIKTPCKSTGKCFDCKSMDTICCQFLITRFSRHKDRIKVILVNEELGF